MNSDVEVQNITLRCMMFAVMPDPSAECSQAEPSWHWWEVGPLEADEDLLLTQIPVTPAAVHCAQQDANWDAVGELECGLSQRDLIWISGNHHCHFPYKKKVNTKDCVKPQSLPE